MKCRKKVFGTSLKGVIWSLASPLAVNSLPAAMADELGGDFRIWNEYKIKECSEDQWTAFMLRSPISR